LTDYKKTVFLNYIATFSNIITGLILFPIIATNLGYEQLGVFSLLFSIKAIADIGVGWMGGAFVKHYIANNALVTNISKCVDAFIFSNVLYALYSLVVIILLFLYKIAWESDIEWLTLSGFCLYIFSCFMMRPIFEVFTACLSQYKVAKYRCIQQIVFFITSIPSIVFLKSIPLVFVFAGISSFIIVLFLNFSNRILFAEIKFPTQKLIKKLLLTDGKNYALFGVGLIIMLQIDLIVFDLVYGSVVVAIFAVAWRVPNTIIQLAWRLSEPMAAIAARSLREGDAELTITLKNIQLKMLVAAIVACIGYYFFIDIFLSWWMPSYDYSHLTYFKEITTLSIFALIIMKLYADLLFYQKECLFSGATFLAVAVIKVVGIVFIYPIFDVLSPLLLMSLFILFISIPLHIKWLHQRYYKVSF